MFGRAFAHRSVLAFEQRARHTHDKSKAGAIRHVFLTIDPSGGGQSHFALVSCYYTSGHMVVAGIEAVAAKRPEDYEFACKRHVELLRARPEFSHCIVVACPEANLGFEASHIARIFNRFEFATVMREAKNGGYGLITTHESKEVCINIFLGRVLRRFVCEHCAVPEGRPPIRTSCTHVCCFCCQPSSRRRAGLCCRFCRLWPACTPF